MKLSEIATALNARLIGDGNLEIRRPVHPAEAETAADLALAMEPGALAMLKDSRARAAVVREESKIPDGALAGYIVVGRSRYAMAQLLALFPRPPQAEPGIHPSAVIAKDATLGRDVRIGPFCSVGARAQIGDGTILLSHVSIGAEARLGAACLLHPGARIGERVMIGDRAIIHHNASIGADGFSFVTPQPGSVETAKASHAVEATNQEIVRVNSIGTVILAEDVEVGACTCIDRGTVSATRIGRNTKIDDQVMIGHNCVIGENCMLCGQVGIAGSTVIGDRVVLGGQVGVGDHLQIGSDSVIAAGALIGTSVPPRSLLVGNPALPPQEAYELYRGLRQLGRLVADVAELKRRGGGKSGS
ncbi:MAG TPA: UDP-3-O-(3-hydroxymyristoyl)glucosamine N-acyltransferase [Alphaproteobacteria bacterium]|nr:UDP-3-O-(3-hydroxymyristoyl)glucosamine N-acyltransferase [Alphaproteobacteria bacterium]